MWYCNNTFMQLSVPNPYQVENRSPDLEELLWFRPKAQPRWTSATLVPLRSTSPVLSALVEAEQRFLELSSDSQELYRPLEEHPELVKTFASLDGSEDSFARFAGQYGLLGVRVLVARGKSPVSQSFAEPLAVWQTLWTEIRFASGLLDLCAPPVRVTALRKITSISNVGVFIGPVMPSPPLRQTQVAGMDAFGVRRPELLKAIREVKSEQGRLVAAARCLVQLTANAWIAGAKIPEISVSPRVLSDASVNKWALRLVPNCLAAALWLQLARALEGDVVHRQCKSPRCRRWFVVSSDKRLGKRVDARYCGQAKCRKDIWRINRDKEQRNGKTTRKR